MSKKTKRAARGHSRASRHVNPLTISTGANSSLKRLITRTILPILF